MDKRFLIKKVIAKISNKSLRDLEKTIPLMLKAEPLDMEKVLNDIKDDHKLDKDQLGDFIQDTLINRYRIITKHPETKEVLKKFIKDNRILGVYF